MYYEIHGTARQKVVLIHGGGSTIQSTFEKMLPLLSNDFQLIAVELQAHGRTTDRNERESFEQDADDVVALLTSLRIGKASFFGFSNGGNSALQIAIRHPDVVEKLIVASAFYKREGMQPGFFEGMRSATISQMPRSLQRDFLKINPDRNKLLVMFEKDRQRMLEFRDWDPQMLLSIKVPVLFIAGDQDVVQTKHTVELAGLVKNSRLLILPSAHRAYMGQENAPSQTREPQMVAGIVKNFLLGNPF